MPRDNSPATVNGIVNEPLKIEVVEAYCTGKFVGHRAIEALHFNIPSDLCRSLRPVATPKHLYFKAWRKRQHRLSLQLSEAR